MTAEYRRELTKNTLVLKDAYNCARDSYQVRMILHAAIPMLLPCRSQMVDGMLYFYYDTTDYQPLSSYFSGRSFQKADMERLLCAVKNAMTGVKEYLLDPSAIWLEPDFVFIAADGQSYAFCYVPGKSASFEEAFGNLAEYFLEHLNHQEKDAVILGYGIYRRVKEGHACLENLMELLTEERKEPDFEEQLRQNRELDLSDGTKNAPKRKRAEKKAEKETAKKAEKREGKKSEKKKSVFWKMAGYGGLAAAGGIYVCLKTGGFHKFFYQGSTAVIEAGNVRGGRFPLLPLLIGILTAGMISFAGVFLYRKKRKKKETEKGGAWKQKEEFLVEHPTVFLKEVCKEEASRKLLDIKTQEEILLEGPVFPVGKLPERGGLILQADTVSRTHACLYQRGEEWYVEDCGSVNGTFVNEQRLEVSEQLQLMPGDEVRFADKGYLFL